MLFDIAEHSIAFYS